MHESLTDGDDVHRPPVPNEETVGYGAAWVAAMLDPDADRFAPVLAVDEARSANNYLLGAASGLLEALLRDEPIRDKVLRDKVLGWVVTYHLLDGASIVRNPQ